MGSPRIIVEGAGRGTEGVIAGAGSLKGRDALDRGGRVEETPWPVLLTVDNGRDGGWVGEES